MSKNKPITKLIRIALSLTPDKGFEWEQNIEWDVQEKEKIYILTRVNEDGFEITKRKPKQPFQILYSTLSPNMIRLVLLTEPEKLEENKSYLIVKAKERAHREMDIAKKNYEESINMCKHCQ